MRQILQFIRPFDVFDSTTMAVLSDAYDKAVASLHDSGQPIIQDTSLIDLLSHLDANAIRLVTGADKQFPILFAAIAHCFNRINNQVK